MIEITPAQIQAAKRGDSDAITAIIREMGYRIGQLARHEGHTGTEVEDLIQQGRVIVWDAAPRFAGDSPAQLFAFLNETLRRELAALRRSERYPGVSEHTAKIWQKALSLASGELDRAVELATSAEVMGAKRKLSQSMAESLREMTDRRPVVSMEALASMSDAARGGDLTLSPYCVRDIRLFEQTVGEAPDPRDINAAQVAETGRRVRWVLTQMGTQQANVLRALVGMGDMPHFDPKARADNEELAGMLGIKVKSLTGQRDRAIDRFREIWLAHFGPVK